MADQSNLEHSAGVATAANGTTPAGNAAAEDKSAGADSTGGSASRPPDVEPYDQEGEDDPEDVDAVSLIYATFVRRAKTRFLVLCVLTQGSTST
jgi:hypothetical protein